MSTPAPPATPLSERHLEVETPEHVALGYELAGPGSRFAAFLYDFSLILLTLLLLVTVVALVGPRIAPLPALPTLLALLVIAMFVIFWGYFIYYEGWRDGQTPGKRRFGLRVVQEGGHPITLRESAIRNLLRLVDAQPFPAWIVGGGMILLHGRAQRLGDIAAGTVVVRERTAASLPEELPAYGPPRLTEREYDVLRQYALRRDSLERRARGRIALQLVPHYMGITNGGQPRPAATGRPSADAAAADELLVRLYAEESGRRAAAGADAGSGSPAAAALLRRQRQSWSEYRTLLGAARSRGLSSLREEQVSRFAALYREVAADLARARTYGASPELLYTLERWVGAGHNLLYVPPLASSRRRVLHWLTAGFPQLVRRRRHAILLAALLLYGSALLSFGAIALDPARARLILPAEMIARAEVGAQRQAEGTGYADVPELAMPLFSSQIITNNVQVSFGAFAGGILAGAGTAALLVLNGTMIGGVVGLFHAEGLRLYLWSFILPHGILELTAICIAGGAGLWLGSALLLPGRRPRRRVLVERGGEAVSLVGGTVILLVIAGVIEGFVSPSSLHPAAKFAFAALTGVLLFQYLIFAGRGRDQA